jgi:hypothetical protein
MDGWALHHTRGIQGSMHPPTLKNMQVDVSETISIKWTTVVTLSLSPHSNLLIFKTFILNRALRL